MLRRYVLLFLLFVLLLHGSAHALAEINEWTVDIQIRDDGSTDWKVVQTYSEPITKADYFVFAGLSNVSIRADGSPIVCSLQETAGTLITCDNVQAKTFQYEFHATGLVSEFKNVLVFRHKFALVQKTGKFRAAVSLPVGALIVEKSKLERSGLERFSPSWGREGSDGRKIFVEWLASEPHLGETYDISIVYETLPQNIVNLSLVLFGVITAAIIIGTGWFIVYHKREPLRNIIPMLDVGERTIIKLLLKEKKPVDQRKLVKESDFSKPKVSRIIKDLADRGVIEKIPKGRTNIIRLLKKQSPAEAQQKEKSK